MCGRTSLFVPLEEVEAYFGAKAAVDLPSRCNIPPGADLATIPNDRPGEIHGLEWGLPPGWVDEPEGWPSPINARAETLGEKPAFRDAFETRRCLVLADGFYEWAGERGHKQPYRIQREDGSPFAFAGLWEAWNAADTERRTVSIITTEANDAIGPIHDRMPVMLERAEHEAWLHGEDEVARRSLLDPFPATLTEVYPVSTRVNDPAHDDPSVVEPIDIGEQSGLGDFGG